MTRCQKYIKQDEGVSYIPNAEDIELPDLPELKPRTDPSESSEQLESSPATPVDVPPTQSASVVSESVPGPGMVQQQETPKEEKVQEETPRQDLNEIEERLGALKEKGNNHFRKKAYKEAIKAFSEAINLYEDTGKPLTHGEIKTKIT